MASATGAGIGHAKGQAKCDALMVRLRWQRRIRKRLRRMRGHDRSIPAAIASLERSGLSLTASLRAFLLDPKAPYHHRAAAGRLLSITGRAEAVQALLDLFLQQSAKDELYQTALSIESLNDRRAVEPLIRALLEDNNPHRRHATARALGWIYRPGKKAALALARCLADPMQPQPAREEAAESLAYVGNRETIEPLISALRDPDVRIRFWAVFGLGQSCRRDARAVEALESTLGDNETPPGNWWPVGREALAALGLMWPPISDYRIRLAAETQRVLSDPGATPEDRRWAEGYSFD